MPETIKRCPSLSETNRACTRDEGHDGPHFHDVVMPRVPRFVTGLSVHGPVIADPLPAHDAPQVERFDYENNHDDIERVVRPDGECVFYDAYATLEAEKQRLEDEMLQIAHGACKSQVETWIARAEAAESQLLALREAVREKYKAEDAYEAVKQAFRAGTLNEDGYALENAGLAVEEADEALRALVLTPQGEK